MIFEKPMFTHAEYLEHRAREKKPQEFHNPLEGDFYKALNPFEHKCLHDQFIRNDGKTCVVGVSCPCPRCTPRC